ncbi:hypothetical protein C8J57DRAFT_1502489 [Mycena rebaudengoi]|nr:hypothetical protein C8J57DRAFT_1502489 [Mycena rebaudengoi]
MDDCARCRISQKACLQAWPEIRLIIVKTASQALEIWNCHCLKLHLFDGSCPSLPGPTASTSTRASSPIYISNFSDDELEAASSSCPHLMNAPPPPSSTAHCSPSPPPPYSTIAPSPKPLHPRPHSQRRPGIRHLYAAQGGISSNGADSGFQDLHAADAFAQMGSSPTSTGHWGLRGVNVIFPSETAAVIQMHALGLTRNDLMGTINAARLEVFVQGKPYVWKPGDPWGDHDEWELVERERRG